ncbi:MAG TPA: molybdate ABC transporter substrate-binding protein [Ktedonobacterales bacterium]
MGRMSTLIPGRVNLVTLALLALSLGSTALAGCGTQTAGSSATTPPSVTLNVFAAASLTGAFGEIATSFAKQNPGVKVSYNFAGSDALAAQITQGAPADAFASANAAQMNVVVKGGHVDGASVKTFAHNRLVVIYPSANPAHLQTLQDLAKPGLKLDLAAATVPVGAYALDFLTKASAESSFGTSYKANVLKNVVSYETDVKVVLSKVSLGEADAGIVYTTDAATETSSVSTIAIPDALNDIALYPIAPVKAASHAALAEQFVAYVDSTAGQATLAKYGFIAGATGAQYAPPAS